MEQAPREVERRSRGRLIAFKALAVLFGLGAAIGLFGAGIIVAWFDTEGGGIHRVHDIGFGVLGGVFLTVGFLAQLHAPERKVSVRYQIVAAGVAAMACLRHATSEDGEPWLNRSNSSSTGWRRRSANS